jgi:hypothetical protein
MAAADDAMGMASRLADISVASSTATEVGMQAANADECNPGRKAVIRRLDQFRR